MGQRITRQQQPKYGLAIVDLATATTRQRDIQRDPGDATNLGRVFRTRLPRHWQQIGRQIERNGLVGETRRRIRAPQRTHIPRAVAGFLAQLAVRGLLRLPHFTRIHQPRGQFPGEAADRLALLPHQRHQWATRMSGVIAQRDNRHGVGMLDHVEQRAATTGRGQRPAQHPYQRATVDLFIMRLLWLHGASLPHRRWLSLPGGSLVMDEAQHSMFGRAREAPCSGMVKCRGRRRDGGTA